MTKKKLLFILALVCGSCVAAQEVRDSVRIYFRQGYSNLDMSLRDNRQALQRIADSLKTNYADSLYRLQQILVVGGASPEGSIPLNKRLSEKRAGVLFDYLSRYGSLPDSLKNNRFLGRDWQGLIQLVERDAEMPYKKETLTLLNEIAREADSESLPTDNHLRRIQQLRGGIPYRYMYRRFFPELRASRLHLWYKKVLNPVAPIVEQPQNEFVVASRIDTLVLHDTVRIEVPCSCRPFYMAIKTNALYDLLFVPNIGVEFYLGKNWSVAANWMYAWWKCDHRHNYWRIYGGDLEVRRWLGKGTLVKPLNGHHIGLYAQMVTYDFERGGRGYLGDRWSYGGGFAYGYSHPLGHRWSIDFTLGIGYLGGEYKEYLPIDNCYVWQSTKQRHWFGPTKAEVSLVWLIGCDNYNRKKGGGKR